MTRKIRDTDIVYSAVSDEPYGPSIIRMALHPVLDSKPQANRRDYKTASGDLPCRAVYAYIESMTGRLWASCRSRGARVAGDLTSVPDRGCWVDEHGVQLDWVPECDDWLDWLAEGEPGR